MRIALANIASMSLYEAHETLLRVTGNPTRRTRKVILPNHVECSRLSWVPTIVYGSLLLGISLVCAIIWRALGRSGGL